MTGSIATFVGGVLTWTLLEYLIHRFGGHEAKGGVEFSREHLTHHAKPDYYTPTPRKVKTAVPVLAVVTAIAVALAGWATALAYTLGVAVGWTTYEVIHRRTHTHPPVGWYSTWSRKHHLHHHFHSPKMNHGVSSPLWDLVFGTYEKPGRIRVPERHVMEWLLDPATGEVRAEHAAEYWVKWRRGAGPAAAASEDGGGRSGEAELAPTPVVAPVDPSRLRMADGAEGVSEADLVAAYAGVPPEA